MNPENNPASPGNRNFERMDLVFTIVSRGLGDKVTEITEKNGVPVNLCCSGRGTATSGILEMFGLGATDKDVIISFVKSKAVPALFDVISKELDFQKPGNGIAFSVPFQSVAGSKALHYLTTFPEGGVNHGE